MSEQTIETILASESPNWDSVELKDIQYALVQRIERRRHLKSGDELRIVLREIGLLLEVKAHMWGARGLKAIEGQLAKVKAKLEDTTRRDNPFDGIYIEYLESEYKRILPPESNQ